MKPCELTAGERRVAARRDQVRVGAEVIWLHQHSLFDEAAEHIQRAESTALQCQMRSAACGRAA